jgi:hypothetical protein
LKIKLLILTFVLLCSCKKNALFDSGKTITREVSIQEYFSCIDVKKTFDITLVQDTIQKVLITCGENLQSLVSANVTDSTLVLDNDVKYKWSRRYEKIKLEVHLMVTPRIDAHEPINLKTRGVLEGDNFTFKDWSRISEADVELDVKSCEIFMVSDNFGYIKLKGKTTRAYLEGWGTCRLRADSLIITNCYVQHRGMNDVYVNVTDQLVVSLEFTGNVCYTGHPGQLIIEKQTSTGRLIDVNK